MHTTARIAAVVSGLALTAGATVGVPLAASAAENSKPAACSQQQKQVDKAEHAPARVTATFEKAKSEKTKPEKPAKVEKAKKAKKAQVQRLAKAQARLDACLAEQTQAG